MRKKLLFITGSMNQTTQMQEIADELLGYDIRFSQIFTDSPIHNFVLKYTRLGDNTILGDTFRLAAENYLKAKGYAIDYKAELNQYDVVIYCSDMLIPPRMRHKKLVWVQEGMIDPYTRWSKVVQRLHLPPYWSGDTSLNGSTNVCDVYCTASQGYKDYITMRGTDESKIFVTGIPNYDNIHQYLNNDFKHKGYVMVATSDIRETFRKEDRIGFLKSCVDIANGRQLLFKLHPNEDIERATAEIKTYTPANTLIYWGGNTHEMIANCVELITQYSTVAYTGIALGKKVHSYFDIEELKRLCPIQNGRTSAKNIAHIIRQFAEFEGKKEDFVRSFKYEPFIDEIEAMLENIELNKPKKGKNTEGVSEYEFV